MVCPRCGKELSSIICNCGFDLANSSTVMIGSDSEMMQMSLMGFVRNIVDTYSEPEKIAPQDAIESGTWRIDDIRLSEEVIAFSRSLYFYP